MHDEDDSTHSHQMRAAFDYALIGESLCGPDGTFLKVNPAFCVMTGYREDELVGRHWRVISTPDDTQVGQEAQKRTLAGETNAYMRERPFVRKDGEVRWAKLSVTLVRDPSGSPQYFVSQLQDITAEREAARQLAESEAQLRQAQKMHAVGQLAGGVAHDFNNLLTVILGYSELLLLQVGASQRIDPDSLVAIRDAGERASHLTRQLLAFSRKAVVETQPLELSELLGRTVKMLQRLIGEDVVLSTRFAAALDRVHADPFQIEQMVMNLAVNARDAMPQGGELTLSTATVSFDSAFCEKHLAYQPGDYVQLKVRDSGTGMGPEVKAHLFEPFFTTKEPGKGTGLGLAMVYGIVQQFCGFIVVDSELGRGTTFEVYLPAVPHDAGRQGNVTELRPGRGHETVLLVEDDSCVRRIATVTLERQGYTVIEAGSGAEALALFGQRGDEIDALVTDVVMPKMSGRELADQLRRRRACLKVLFMSGYNDDAAIRHGLLDGLHELLRKPFTPQTLAQRVRELLDDRRAGAEHAEALAASS